MMLRSVLRRNHFYSSWNTNNKIRYLATSSQKKRRKLRVATSSNTSKVNQQQQQPPYYYSGTKQNTEKNNTIASIDPAFLFLGLFPLAAAGMMVFLNDNFRQQVMDNWKYRPNNEKAK